MRRRIGHRGTGGCKARRIGGKGIAGPGFILALRFGIVGNRHRGIGDVVRLEKVGQVQFGGGAGLDADGGTIQFLGRRHAQLFLHHEALTVVIVDGDEIELQVVVARKGPGRIADQQVNLARRQRGKPGFAGGRHIFHLGLVAQNGGSQRLAQIDVKALIVAFGIGRAETGQTGVRPADQFATGLDVIQRASRRHARHQPGSRQRG